MLFPLSIQTSSTPSPDFNDNGIVDIPDFLLFVDVFGSQRGQEKYEEKYDLDMDGKIGVSDFLIFIDNFGKEVNRDEPSEPPPPPPPPPIPQVTISAVATPVTEGAFVLFRLNASPVPTSVLIVNVNVSEVGNVISGIPSFKCHLGTAG